MTRPLLLAAILAALVLGGGASAQSLHAGVRLGGAPGPVYFGVGLGLRFAGGGLDARLVVGYQWPLTDCLGAFVEAVPRLSLGGGGPQLDLVAGLSLRVLGPPAP